jgi:hypothetical protein
MADGRKLTLPSHINQPKSLTNPVNQARAMRVAEIINDYRTLLVHISQQNVEPSQEEYWEDGFVVLRESLASAQTLMSANYQPCPVTGGNAETEKAELQRYTHPSPATNDIKLTPSQGHTGRQRTSIPSTQDLPPRRRSTTMGHDPRQHSTRLKCNSTTLYSPEERNCHAPSGSGSFHGPARRGGFTSC